MKQSRWSHRFDVVLAGAVLVFAFLAASFPVRNGDFWQHLATGRLLANGEYTFGVDPFSSTTEGGYWANHSWLFDFLLYGLYSAIGGAGVVVLKALLIVALAWTMMRIRTVEGPGWLAPACTALAILAMSPRLLMQPACVSYFLLGLTLWLLWRGGLLVLLVPSICALWVNLDAWFLLGPLLVGLFWVAGKGTPQVTNSAKPQAAERQGRVSGTLVLASLAACLCSPHHFRVFVLPLELSVEPGVIALRQDTRFQPLFASPWETGLRFESVAAISLAAWAYFALLALGLLSFVLARTRVPAWRVVVWLVFALLGAWQARLVPFFAVVAGPITALNFLTLTEEKITPSSLLVSLSSRLLVFFASLALIALAWPGWLSGFRHGERHVGWTVEPNASLLRSTQTLHAWRQAGKIPRDEHILAVHPDVAHYWAWYCPDEKGFLDHRFTLFGSVATTYEGVCRSLLPALTASPREDRGGGNSSDQSWRQVLRDLRIRFAVLFDPDRARLGSALPGLAVPGGEWTLCAVDGQALLLRWNDPDETPPAGSDRLDPDYLAFARQDSEDSALPAAPGTGPASAPAARTLWSEYLRPTRQRAWESATAFVYLRLYDERFAFERKQMLVKHWARLAGGMVGLVSGGSGVPARASALAGLYAPGAFQALADRPSPALPLLAIRAARRALADNPDDASAALALGRAYLVLGAVSGEVEQGGPNAPLPLLRHVQAAGALQRALSLQPELEAGHAALVELYGRREYFDAALAHLQAQLRLAQSRPRSGKDHGGFASRLVGLERSVEELEKLVQDRQHQFTVQTGLPGAGTDPVSRALLARQLGLPGKALEILERSQVEVFGSAGARLQLELLLMLGRAGEAREKLLDEEMQANGYKLGLFQLPVFAPGGQGRGYKLPAYEWLCLSESAANGDYDRAEELLALIGERLRAEEARMNLPRLRSAMAETVTTEVGLGCMPSVLTHTVQWLRVGLCALYAPAAELPDERADLETVAGLLALERGLPELARRHLMEARKLSSNFVALPVVEVYIGRLNAQP
jgi:tetratricopeptide (TPR) repeat protein